MLERRNFLKRTGGLLGALYASPLAIVPDQSFVSLPHQLRAPTDFWDEVGREFSPSDKFVNLENGFYSPQPKRVRDAYIQNIDYVNSLTSYYMRNQWEEDRQRIKVQVARNVGCEPGEFLFTRNTTESLNTVIMGIPLKPGDEILISDLDYPSAFVQWNFRAKRDSLKLTILSIGGLNDDQIAELFEKNIGPRTRILHTTHMIHATGQVLPVRKLSEIARAKGVEIIVDGAHSFNHIDYTIQELQPDYFMCSFHKWTLNPLGSGMLYIHPSKLKKLSPLFGEINFAEDDIRKMERLGTLEPPVFLTLPVALDFHHFIGAKRKEQRLFAMKNYWADKIARIPRVKINTPLTPGHSGAIGNFSIEGIENKQVVKELFDKHRIFVNDTDDFPVQGVRVTVHLYTTQNDLDTFIGAIEEIAKR